MNVKKAIRIIRERDNGARVEKIPNRRPDQKRWAVYGDYGTGGPSEYTDRGLIKYAQIFDGSKDTHALKRVLKYFNHRKNRHKTRQKIKERRFSDIPQNKPVHREDPWY